LNLLAFKGYTHLLRLVYEQYHAIQNLADSHGRTALQLAARSGHINTFKYLLSLGLNPKTKDAKGDSLLHYASSGSSLQVLNVVLGKGLTSSPQSGHWTPLHWACRTGNPNIVERLIKEGLRSECVTLPQPEGQWSPISIAIFHGNGKMLEELSAPCRSLLGTGPNSSAADAVQLNGRRHGGYWCNGCFHVSR
jgi:ankyrin repeat protein